MNWKTVADKISPLKNLIDNDRIKNNLESLSLYNCRVKQMLDGKSEELEICASKEEQLRENTLNKIYELQKQVQQAQNPEEEASKLIECFLYIDNYLNFYCEPEFFFVRKRNSAVLYDFEDLKYSEIKFAEIIRGTFFFQELNTRAHISLHEMCSSLMKFKKDTFEFIDKLYFVTDRLDFLNDRVFEQNEPDEDLLSIYPFVLIINFTMQKLMIHRFASIYPSQADKKTFKEIIKQKENTLDRIKDKIIKRAVIIRRLKEKITEPLNLETYFDEKCVEIYNEEIIAKRDEAEKKNDSSLLIINKNKINECCEAAYWVAFLAANKRQAKSGEENISADEWLAMYLEISKDNNYGIIDSLRKFILQNKVSTAETFNNLKIKRKGLLDSVFARPIPLWLAGIIALILAAIFIYFIVFTPDTMPN